MPRRTLTIIDSDGRMSEVDLERYDRAKLYIGRDENKCDIVIKDSIISKIHGCIQIERTYLMYRDEDSSNGTYIGNWKNQRLLKKDDGYVDLCDRMVLRIGNIHAPDKMVLIVYHVAEERENWKRQSIGEKAIKIGRANTNQVVLQHPAVSKEHCVIFKDNGETFLADMKSSNGVMINGKPIESCQKLKDKDIIQILDFQLLYSNTYIYYRTLTTGISLRACEINKVVGKGIKKKKILRDVNCEIYPNEFVAIIGGSGAGKTTLMNAISGFEKEFTGHVYCNNVDLIEQFQHLKNIIGFVPQQDIIYENLTLKRMLLYTARLKMPEDTQKEEILHRIEEVLKMVDLWEHKESYIKKLSGGQKKRASIAVELLADPKLFFLDEPTSGLDPGTEKSLMITLKELAKEQNKTIVMVTHTTQNLDLCDKIIFMGPGGSLCFVGSVEEAKKFYQTDDLVNIYNMLAEETEYWQRKYEDICQKSAPLHTIQEGVNKQQKNEEKKTGKKLTTNFRQFLILTQRYAELIWNDCTRLLVLLLQPLMIAWLLSLVADENLFDIYESTKSILFALSCSGIWIGMFDSIQEICKERVILKREYMANLKLPCYMMSKFVIQTLLGLFQAIILTVAFLKLTKSSQRGIFLESFHTEIFLTIWLTILASIAMGFIISAIAKSGDKAMTAAPFLLIVQLLFSGILFELKGIGEKISYCTVSRWSVETLGSISRLNILDLKMQSNFPMIEHKAEVFFRASKAHILAGWTRLAGMIIVMIVLATMLLKSVANDRR